MMRDLAMHEGDPEFMMSLAKGLAVLRLVAEAAAPLTIAEATRQAGLSRAATRRCLYTLAKLGYVTQEGGGFVGQTDRFALGSAFAGSSSLPARAQPLLDRLRDRLGESCSLGILDGDQVRYVARAQAARIVSINLRVGSRLPLYVTSMGRVLLAGTTPEQREAYLARTPLKAFTDKTETSLAGLRRILAQVERGGFAIVDQEFEDGLRSVSVPVRGRTGVEAALNVGCSAGRITNDHILRHILPALKEVAGALSTPADR